MINKHFKKIALLLLLVVIAQGFFESPYDISPEDEMYRLKIHDLTQEKIEDNSTIDSLTKTNIIYENFYDSLENDNSIDTVKSKQLKINLSNYAKSRRG